ncbi:MAG: 30S ribosomal protein S7 [Patescibacteria group bacterium]
MRSKQAPKRKIPPDPKYHSLLVQKFINQVMLSGKKSIAQKIVYQAFEKASEKSKKEPLAGFEEAIKNISPILEVKSRRIGGANYQVPVEVRGERKTTLAFRWLIEVAKKKKGKPMAEKLAEEIVAAQKKEGEAIKKREDVHRMAEANRAFAHFA